MMIRWTSVACGAMVLASMSGQIQAMTERSAYVGRQPSR
jgi:hypothetical protein